MSKEAFDYYAKKVPLMRRDKNVRYELTGKMVADDDLTYEEFGALLDLVYALPALEVKE